MKSEIRVNIDANIQKYNEGRGKLERFASFDYCFNYFQQFRKEDRLNEMQDDEHLQDSCLQLGFFLASWGMYRGSAFLPDKSVRVFDCVIKDIADQPLAFWEIDAHCYTPDNIRSILDFKEKIKRNREFSKSTDTLITKIMLGVFGNVPAFDTNFKKGFGVSTFEFQPLQEIAEFYKKNSNIIDEHQNRRALDFNTGLPTGYLYTRAKVIDMIFFQEGENRRIQSEL